MIKHGLKPTVKSKTDRSFHRTFGGVTPALLLSELSIDSGLTMPDQNADGLPEACTAYAQNELCTDQDKVVYDDYRDIYTKTLALENAPFGSGCDIRDSLKVVIAYHSRGAYYAVESSQFDWFDSIRSVIQTNLQNNNIRCAVSIGTPWFKEWDIMGVHNDGIIPQIFTGDPSTLSWHNWCIKGWKLINGVTYVLAKTWQGKNYGDSGWSFYSRETINAVMAIKYTAAYTVAPRNAANIATVKWTLMDMIQTFIRQLIALLSIQKSITPAVQNIVQKVKQQDSLVVPIVPAKQTDIQLQEAKNQWQGFDNSKKSVRIICDEQSLSLSDKDLICAVIQQESNFQNSAVCHNKDKAGNITSSDWGLCQINDYYHIGKGKDFPSVDYVVNNPDQAVLFMIKMFKAGKLGLWVAYSSGAYKKYLTNNQ